VGAQFAGAVFICANDLLPRDNALQGIVDRMKEEKKLIHLFEMSDLYGLWKEERLQGRE
jgi:hypothetical protein